MVVDCTLVWSCMVSCRVRRTVVGRRVRNTFGGRMCIMGSFLANSTVVRWTMANLWVTVGSTMTSTMVCGALMGRANLNAFFLVGRPV